MSTLRLIFVLRLTWQVPKPQVKRIGAFSLDPLLLARLARDEPASRVVADQAKTQKMGSASFLSVLSLLVLLLLAKRVGVLTT